MPDIQNLVHKLELGGGDRHIKMALSVLVLLFVFLTYNYRSFQNMSTPEAMDSAQLARNLATGEGYTTQFIRPYSIQLLTEKAAQGEGEGTSDPGRLKEAHPDISNAPAYPFLLAAWMKVMPFNFDCMTPRPFWYRDNSFWRHQPDFLISILNQLLMVGMLVATWFLTRRLFDEEAAWIATLGLLGVELLWRFSVSGLSTMLLMLLVSGVFWTLHLLEAEGRQDAPRMKRALIISVSLGALLGLIALTRYSMMWLAIPAVAFVALFGGRLRRVAIPVMMAVFLVLLLPWVARNIHVSGLPFGTATHATIENTGSFPEHQLQRSLDADVKGSDYLAARYKLMSNLRTVFEQDLMNLGNTWLPWFFVVGLMVAFRNPATQRLRYFLLMAFGTFVLVQALARTKLSSDSPVVNSENLLILFLPMMIIYGVAFFLMLLDNIKWSLPVFRRAAIITFLVISALPLLLTLAPPRAVPVAYPPYYPPHIQNVSSWMKDSELMMSDVPWAVAWYGDRRALWLTLNVEDDFYAINDFQKPVRGLFLTAITTDAQFVSNFIRTQELTWGDFVFKVFRNGVPGHFPLRIAPPLDKYYLNWPEEVFLTDWARWEADSE